MTVTPVSNIQQNRTNSKRYFVLNSFIFISILKQNYKYFTKFN
jgi:hypothetical protein